MDGSVSATRVLRDLLVSNPRYRRRWEQHAHRNRSGDVSQAAVAQVVAMHLWDSGERHETEIDLARKLRDRVRRALRGEKLSGETLTWIVQAFEMEHDDEQALWRAFAGGGIRSAGVVGTMVAPRELVRPQLHRTVSLFERYSIDSLGRLTGRHTMHVIGAVEHGVNSYLYNHEPLATRIEIVAGGKLGERFTYGDGLISDEVVLDAPLRRGYTTSMEYRTTYPDTYSPLEVRRAVRGRCENVDIAIQFDRSAIPSSVRFAAWSDHYLGDPVLTETASPDATGFVHRFVPYAEQTVIGFQWNR